MTCIGLSSGIVALSHLGAYHRGACLPVVVAVAVRVYILLLGLQSLGAFLQANLQVNMCGVSLMDVPHDGIDKACAFAGFKRRKIGDEEPGMPTGGILRLL